DHAQHHLRERGVRGPLRRVPNPEVPHGGARERLSELSPCRLPLYPPHRAIPRRPAPAGLAARLLSCLLGHPRLPAKRASASHPLPPSPREMGLFFSSAHAPAWWHGR